MIKQLTQTLHQYMDTTNKEIENIKKIVNLNYKLTTEGKENSENFKDETNDRIQNIIITQKELIQRWEAIGSQFESMIDNTTNFTNKPNKKNRINNEAGIKIHSKNGKWQPANKAILYNRYIPNKARIVTHSWNSIKTYKVSLDYWNNRKIFYVNYRGRWVQLKFIIEKLRREGLVFGFKRIKEILKLKNKTWKDILKQNNSDQKSLKTNKESTNNQQ